MSVRHSHYRPRLHPLAASAQAEAVEAAVAAEPGGDGGTVAGADAASTLILSSLFMRYTGWLVERLEMF